MKRSAAFVVLALVAVLALFWFRSHVGSRGINESHGSQVRHEEDGNRLSPGGPQQKGDVSTQTEGDRRKHGPEQELSAESQQLAPSAGASLLHSSQRQEQVETPSSGNSERTGNDFGVIGRGFPISDSVLAACESASTASRWCDANRKLLSEMAKEPRNEPWATQAEQAIRALVELEPGTQTPRSITYTIRALECRSSICFVETASTLEGFRTQLYDFEKTSGLRAEYPVYGYETDEYGSKVCVTLWPFLRR